MHHFPNLSSLIGKHDEMKYLLTTIILVSSLSCGPSYCDECVDTEHTIVSSTGLQNLSIYSANIVSEYNTYYKVVIEHDPAEWNNASIRIFKDEITLIDMNQGINIKTITYSSTDVSSILTIPITDININGEFPNGEVHFEGSLSSDDHSLTFTGSTHFYQCESVIDDFDQLDCRYSCQISHVGFGEYDCTSQLCPF